MIMNTSDQDGSQHKRLVLCFDGTAKKFAGNQTDSNGIDPSGLEGHQADS